MELLIILVLLVIAIVFICNVSEFDKQSYHEITGNGYLQTLNDKGLYGEYAIYNRLQYLEDRGAKFLFNLYIPRVGKESETTEVDVVAITEYGLLVFESKNYGGWIFGDEKSTKWCQSLYSKYTGKQKYFFYNPIRQNRLHIDSLKQLLWKNGYKAVFWNIVVFPDECEIKKMSVYSKNTFVAQVYELCSLANSIDCPSNIMLTEEMIEKVYEVLYPYSQVTYGVKEKHIEDIRK